MSGWAVARRASAVVLLSMIVGPMAARANDAANAMAEKFANDAERAEARRQQAQTKRKTQSKSTTAPKQDAQRRTDAQRKSAEDKRRAATKAAGTARQTTEQRNADEADMLARARREAEEMRASEEQAQLAEEARRLIIEAEKERANAEALLERERQRAAEGRIKAPPANADTPRREAAEAEARRSAVEAAERDRARTAEEEKLAQLRREETRRLIEKLNRMRQIREARLAAQERRTLAEANKREAPPYALGAAPPRVEADDPDGRNVRSGSGVPTMAPPLPPPGEPRMALGGRDGVREELPARYAGRWSEGRVTVLLILAPGNYGIRRNGPKVADPILCTLEGCYVSAGADRPAGFMPGRRALGFGNTWGARAGACRQRLGCVFRGIDLGDLRGYLQPVDLHILRHDRRRPHQIAGDSACRADGGRLVCGRGIYAEDYAMWIVPERVAEAAGPAALERAVAEGLNGPRSADIFPLLGR